MPDILEIKWQVVNYVLFILQCLLSLADLRDSYKFPHKAEIDAAVGMAVRSMGPRHVLEAIPLQITGEE